MQLVAPPAALTRGVPGPCARRFEKCANSALLLVRPRLDSTPSSCRNNLDGGFAIPENEHTFPRPLDFPHETGKSLVGFAKVELFHAIYVARP